jgi:ATP phosphoribosyltransferase regulatory subunit
LPRIAAALDVLERLAAPLDPSRVSIDLADLRGYHYHSGTMFAAYCPGLPNAIAQGGRYDEVGLAFGRARPATGFSLDLRELAGIATIAERKAPIVAPAGVGESLRAAIAALRRRGETVVQDLVSSDGDPLSTARMLVSRGDGWIVENRTDPGAAIASVESAAARG